MGPSLYFVWIITGLVEFFFLMIPMTIIGFFTGTMFLLYGGLFPDRGQRRILRKGANSWLQYRGTVAAGPGGLDTVTYDELAAKDENKRADEAD